MLGPSGCGKSTLLRLISGLDSPTSGSIEFDGRDVTRVPPQNRDVGFVFQHYALWPHMTVRENLSFGLALRKLSTKNRRDKIAYTLDKVGLTELHARYPHELSGGQQQRVALARALVLEPKVLLLDEPLSNLDQRLRQRLQTELQTLQRELKITTLFVSHDPQSALAIGDRIALMDRGSVVQLGTPSELAQSPSTEFVKDFFAPV